MPGGVGICEVKSVERGPFGFANGFTIEAAGRLYMAEPNSVTPLDPGETIFFCGNERYPL